MVKDNVVEFRGREAGGDLLTELLKAGAQKLICQAVEAELEELLALHAERRTAEGNAGVVRNGYLPKRELQTGVGPVTVRIPKVRARAGDPVTFRSSWYHRMCARRSRWKRRCLGYIGKGFQPVR